MRTISTYAASRRLRRSHTRFLDIPYWQNLGRADFVPAGCREVRVAPVSRRRVFVVSADNTDTAVPIIADQVRSSDPVVSIANDAGRSMPCAALAPLTRAELGRRTFLRLQLISGCCIRKDAERTKSETSGSEAWPRPSETAPAEGPAGAVVLCAFGQFIKGTAAKCP
jgi:hypothetical protein